GRASAARRLGLGELLPGDGPGGAVRRLQDVRLRPGVRQAASGRISQRQGSLDQDGLANRRGACSPSPRPSRVETSKARSERVGVRGSFRKLSPRRQPLTGLHRTMLRIAESNPASPRERGEAKSASSCPLVNHYLLALFFGLPIS